MVGRRGSLFVFGRRCCLNVPTKDNSVGTSTKRLMVGAGLVLLYVASTFSQLSRATYETCSVSPPTDNEGVSHRFPIIEKRDTKMTHDCGSNLKSQHLHDTTQRRTIRARNRLPLAVFFLGCGTPTHDLSALPSERVASSPRVQQQARRKNE